jgi:hypothetical protein
MHPVLIVLIPISMLIIGMVINSIGVAYDQPRSSPEQDPMKRLTAEKESYRKAFDLQRGRSVTRQKHTLQFGWLLLVSFIGACIWLYAETVNRTSLATRVAALQTLATEEGKQMVLSISLADGNNVKYIIKLPQAEKSDVTKEVNSNEKVSSWELERLGTAISTGDNSLPLGIALKISH